MQKNLLKRTITSIFLLILLFIINFSNQFIFLISILILGLIICIEANNIFSKLSETHILTKESSAKRINFKFLILNLLTFCYIFFVFCNFSYEIHKIKSPTLFFYIVSICFFTDIGGYIIGKMIGGVKLTKISPNKTISGSAGSFIFCIIPLILFLNLGYLDLKMNLNNIIFCLVISLVSQLGDLFVSFFKRKAKIKHTGKVLPGHGGVLDRVDGIIFAVPISYFLLKLI